MATSPARPCIARFYSTTKLPPHANRLGVATAFRVSQKRCKPGLGRKAVIPPQVRDARAVGQCMS